MITDGVKVLHTDQSGINSNPMTEEIKDFVDSIAIAQVVKLARLDRIDKLKQGTKTARWAAEEIERLEQEILRLKPVVD